MAKAYKCDACQKLYEGDPAYYQQEAQRRPVRVRRIDFKYGKEPYQFKLFQVHYTVRAGDGYSVPELCQGCLEEILSCTKGPLRLEK